VETREHTRHLLSFFVVLFAIVALARLCHMSVLWAEENLPLAAARQMLYAKVLYREIWFDKPPLLASAYLLWAAKTGWILRLAGAVYVLLISVVAYLFARDLWSRREGYWAAALLAFFLTFDLPSAVVPLAADLLMLAPHLAAVYLAWKGRAFWSGVLAGIAFLINTKGLFVLAACALWTWRSPVALALGFALPNAVAAVWLWSQGALADYYLQVWKWGRVYAGGTFVASPFRNGLVRMLDWAGFHAAIVAAALLGMRKDSQRWRFAAWALISLAAVAAGWRFFPRYFFQLLPVAAIAAARGFNGPRRLETALVLLLLVPLARFGPRYITLFTRGLDRWADVDMDQDSREAARRAQALTSRGDTLFVWGFRPELYVYTDLPAGSRFLDSQPLTGVPADRHLTQSDPVAADFARANRAELATTSPTLIMDGLGLYNPKLAITRYEDLQPWFKRYREVDRSRTVILYKLMATNEH
jgi:hypothetical protein